MNTVKFEHKNTLVVAHRGLSGLETENTVTAFVAAGNRSYYGIETDMRRTADGRFVIIHDDNLKRIAGESINVEQTTMETLQSVILYNKDGTRSRKDLRLCALEDYISVCKKYEKHAVLELKSDFTDEETARYIEIIRSFDYLDHVTFIAFNYENLLKIRKILPSQSVQYLFWELTDETLERLVADKIDVDINYKSLTEENIDRLHKAGLEVNCWTVDSKEDAERLALWGVDYITSNILE